MAAGASSGVDVVTAGSAACADSETGRFENSATFWVRFAPDFHSADWSGLVRHDELERLAVRGREENCGN